MYRRADANTYQFGLKAPKALRHHFPGPWATRCSLGTSDLREANAMAKALHAEWAARFAALERADNPAPVAHLTPELGAAIAAELRRWVLEADDNMRAFQEGPRALVRREERARTSGSPRLTIPMPQPPRDPLEGLSDDELGALSRFNSAGAARAATDLASRRLRKVQELADMVARSMGLLVDWSTERGRAGLLACLKAYRTASEDTVRRDAGEVVDTPEGAPLAALQQPAATPSAARQGATEGKRISDAFDAWKGAKTRSDKTARTVERAAGMFSTMMGDPKLAELVRTDGITFRDRMQAWAVAEGKAADHADNLLGYVRTLLNVARDRGWIQANPLDRLSVEEGGRATESREPWTHAELPVLFSSPLFNCYAIPAGNRTANRAGLDAAYWVPLLGLYTGARSSELCQLWTDDVSEGEGGLTVEFRDNPDRGQRLKVTANRKSKKAGSWRATPIHSELIRLGFRDYWRAIIEGHQGKSGPLFPAIRREGQNGAGGQFGQWFGDYKRGQGFASEGKVFHSFRHLVSSELRLAGVGEAIVNAIVGHAGDGVGQTVYSATIRREAERLRPYVEHLRFPGLSLTRTFVATVWKA